MDTLTEATAALSTEDTEIPSTIKSSQSTPSSVFVSTASNDKGPRRTLASLVEEQEKNGFNFDGDASNSSSSMYNSGGMFDSNKREYSGGRRNNNNRNSNRERNSNHNNSSSSSNSRLPAWAQSNEDGLDISATGSSGYNWQQKDLMSKDQSSTSTGRNNNTRWNSNNNNQRSGQSGNYNKSSSSTSGGGGSTVGNEELNEQAGDGGSKRFGFKTERNSNSDGQWARGQHSSNSNQRYNQYDNRGGGNNNRMRNQSRQNNRKDNSIPEWAEDMFTDSSNTSSNIGDGSSLSASANAPATSSLNWQQQSLMNKKDNNRKGNRQPRGEGGWD